MRELVALVAAIGCTAPRQQVTKPIANAAAADAPVLGKQLIAEWSLLSSEGDVTIALRVGDRRIAIGTFYGGVYPAWQSYCDRKMGYLPARNVELATKHAAIAKLTITHPQADFENPSPAGSVTFFVKRPAPDRLEVWAMGGAKPIATFRIEADARIEEMIDDDDDRPGFHCGGDDGMDT